MISALPRLPPPVLTPLASTNATGAALRALLTPGAPAGNSDFTAAWAGANADDTVVAPAPRASAPARETAVANNLSGLAQLLKDIAVVTRASAASGMQAANDAAHNATHDAANLAQSAISALSSTSSDALVQGGVTLAEPPEVLPPALPQTHTWSVQAWPGQRAEFQITHWQRGQRGAGQAYEEGEQWHTRVRVDLPRLGKLEAAVALSAKGLHVAVKAEDSSALTLLESGRDELHEVLSRAGLNPVGLHISRLKPE